MNKFNYFEGMDKVSQHLTPILHRGNKVLVFISITSITSKSRIGLKHITDFGTFLEQNGHKETTVSMHLKVRLVVSTGTRMDYTTAVGNKIETDCASLDFFGTAHMWAGPEEAAAPLLLGRRRQGECEDTHHPEQH